MIVERELEIEAFKPREYWTIEADVSKNDQPFMSRLVSYKGDKVEQFSFENEAQAREVEKTLLDAADGKLTTCQRNQAPATPKPGRAVYDVHAPAGSVTQARLQYAVDNARRAETV